MLPTVIALAISTILNAVYFLRLVITLYTIPEESSENKREEPANEEEIPKRRPVLSPGTWKLHLAIVSFILLNLTLGLYSQPVVAWIGSGLAMFD